MFVRRCKRKYVKINDIKGFEQQIDRMSLNGLCTLYTMFLACVHDNEMDGLVIAECGGICRATVVENETNGQQIPLYLAQKFKCITE